VIPVRHAARLVVLSPERRVLLFDTEVLTAEDPLRPNTTRFWNTPGGGVEAGETFEQTALRELREETGITASLIGPCVWTSNRVLCFDDGRRMRFRERFFLVEAPSEEADISQLFGDEADWIKGYRWWSADEIEASDDTFCPGHIAALVRDLAEGRVPKLPVCIDKHSEVPLARAS
jgi:8-oxo-dGTP pyrophosphatase MutT (NUDIX family)